MYVVVRANLLLKRKPGFQLSSDDHHVTDTLRNNVIALIILWILYVKCNMQYVTCMQVELLMVNGCACNNAIATTIEQGMDYLILQ